MSYFHNTAEKLWNELDVTFIAADKVSWWTQWTIDETKSTKCIKTHSQMVKKKPAIVKHINIQYTDAHEDVLQCQTQSHVF